jgi:hypothetical protein
VLNSQIIVSSTRGLHPKQQVTLSIPGQTPLLVEIKRVLSATNITVGEPNQGIKNQYNQTILVPYDGGTFTAYEQSRNPMGMEPVIRAVYEEEPTIALRTVMVDPLGNMYDADNPIPIKIESLNDSVLSLGTEDGTLTGIQHVIKVGSDLNLRVKDEGANTLLSSIDSKLTSPITVSLPGVATSAKQDIGNASLASIDSKLTNPIDIRDLNADQDDVMIAGSINGLSTGAAYHFVYNLRQQILATHDRQQAITYADFGTKDERITSIVYTSITFPGHSATKTMTYTNVGGKYRRDSINWTVI